MDEIVEPQKEYKKRGRKRKHSMHQRIDINLSREIMDTWAGEKESFADVIKNMHEALMMMVKIAGHETKISAKELKDELKKEEG